MKRPLALPAVAIAISLAAVAASCGSSGRELRDPPPGETAAPRRTSTTVAAISSTVAGLNLSSSAFAAGARIPTEYTCDGAGISPPLAWSGVPFDATSLALVVVDEDAGGAVHWIVTGIPPAIGSITKGTPPTGGTQLKNSFGTAGWTAPCSETAHTYEFYLLAFVDPPNVEQVTDPKQVVSLLQQTSSNSSVFLAKFSKAGGGQPGGSGGSAPQGT